MNPYTYLAHSNQNASSSAASNYSPSKPLSRDLLVTLIQTGLNSGEHRFARRAALAWLTAFPGDLQVALLHAQALMQEWKSYHGKSASGAMQALTILENVCLADPEYAQAQSARLECQRMYGTSLQEGALGNLVALQGGTEVGGDIPRWGDLVYQSRKALSAGNIEEAENLIHQALLLNSSAPLIAVTHLMVESRRGLPLPSIRSLAEIYHERWPACQQFTLILADALIGHGDTEQGVALLHQAVAGDVIGQVAQRLWGREHPYRSLWPAVLEAPLSEDLAVPASIGAQLGWNRLAAQATQPPPAAVEEPLTTPVDIPQASPTPLPAVEIGSIPAQPVAQVAAAPTQDSAEAKKRRPAKVPLTEIQIPPQPVSQNAQAVTTLPSSVIALPGSAAIAPTPAVTPAAMPLPAQRLTQPPSAEAETLQSVKQELDKVAERLKQPLLARADGRFPVYVVFSTRWGLENYYGAEGASLILEAMNKLTDIIRASQVWGAVVYFPDEGLTIQTRSEPNGITLKPVQPEDAWGLKLSLANLDEALAKRGEMIGAVLIVGGPEVVPFHRLPNPVDDVDSEVYSDNPYGTRDDNYFIPEWAIGRLPGGAAQDPAALMLALKEITEYHEEAQLRSTWLTRLLGRVFSRLVPSRLKPRHSLCYTAAIWRQASTAVFRSIGDTRDVFTSPPVRCVDEPQGSANKNPNHNGRLFTHPLRMGHFNLHGLEDSVEWYGQKDPTEPSLDPDYPVALRPQDFGLNEKGAQTGFVPRLVFSEACYGAHILGRTVDQAISLKFLTSGCLAVIGSTCTSYGSVAAPLAAADLLGFAFWNYIDEGLPAGEALRRAKIHLAREMHRRQGYLDGEDQKTLISFVLYGDPLAMPLGSQSSAKGVFRSLKRPAQVKTVCDRHEEVVQKQPLSEDVQAYVQHIVSQYLPGMNDAELFVTQEIAGCGGHGHTCPTAQLGAKARPNRPPERRVVTLSKSVQMEKSIHHHYARLTLDAQGKLVKLVVSR